MIVYGEAFIRRSPIPIASAKLRQRRHGHPRWSKRIIHEPPAAERRIAAGDGGHFKPQPFVEQGLIVKARQWIAGGQSRRDAVQAVAGNDQIVAGRELGQHELHFSFVVGLFKRIHLLHLKSAIRIMRAVNFHRQRQRVVPLLSQNHRIRRRVSINPLRERDPRMRRGIHVDKSKSINCHAARERRRAGPHRLPSSRQFHQHPRAEQRNKWSRRQHVAWKFNHE